MRINLTQHAATTEQECEPRTAAMAAKIKGLLTFDTLPDECEIKYRAIALAEIARDLGATEAMIGGAPYLIMWLAPNLRLRGIKPLCAFTKRESAEVERDGKTVKTSVFKHLGFVDMS